MQKIHLIAICVVFSIISTPVEGFQCPEKCQCKDNVTEVKCEGSLIKLPDLPGHVERLDLSHNLLGPVIGQTFFYMSELRYLDLSHNGLVNMTERGLRGLTKLEVLVLSHNNLRFLPKNIFCDNTLLKRLDVSNNLFSVMPDHIFRSLDNLRFFSIGNNKVEKLLLGPRWQVPRFIEELDFSDNRFDNISQNAFEFTAYWDVTVKRSLNLRNCGIKFIDNGTFAAFKGLHSLDLSHNPGIGGERLHGILLEMENSRLKELDVSGMRLTTIDTLFADVDQLALESLDLAQNFLRSIPSWAVGNVRSLQYLNISTNHLTSDISGLKDLSNLRSLDLSRNQILAFPREITSVMSRLVFLDLSTNQIKEASDIDLSPLLNLKVLDISDNKLNSLVLPGNTSDLEVLNFADNQITQLFSIHNIPKLMRFDISGNKLTTLSSFLFSQTFNFQIADFSNNEISEIDHRSFLPSAPTVIDLSHNSLKEVKFCSWTDASTIHLHHNEIVEVSYQAFYGMSGLNHVDMSHNKLETLPENVFKYLVQLDSLNLSNNLLSIKPDVFVDILKPLKSLQTVDLSHNQLSSINHTMFKSSPNIQKLSLAYNKFAFLPVSMLNHLDNLTDFDASGNPFRCDCNLLPFRDWMREHRKTKMIRSYNRTKYVCVEPSGRKGTTIVKFTENRFECNKSLLFMIIFGSIGGFLILIGIAGSLACHYYRKWRKHQIPIKIKKKQKRFSADRIRKRTKEYVESVSKNGGVKADAVQNGGREVAYLVNEKEGRLGLEKEKRLPHYRSSKYQVLPHASAENWQKLRSRNDPRRFHTVNPRMHHHQRHYYQSQPSAWDRWEEYQNYNGYPTIPLPASRPDVSRSRTERGVTFERDYNQPRRSVDDSVLETHRHRYRHPRDLHRNPHMIGYGERKYSMPNVHVYDKQSDWV